MRIGEGLRSPSDWNSGGLVREESKRRGWMELFSSTDYRLVDILIRSESRGLWGDGPCLCSITRPSSKQSRANSFLSPLFLYSSASQQPSPLHSQRLRLILNPCSLNCFLFRCGYLFIATWISILPPFLYLKKLSLSPPTLKVSRGLWSDRGVA